MDPGQQNTSFPQAPDSSNPPRYGSLPVDVSTSPHHANALWARDATPDEGGETHSQSSTIKPRHFQAKSRGPVAEGARAEEPASHASEFEAAEYEPHEVFMGERNFHLDQYVYDGSIGQEQLVPHNPHATTVFFGGQRPIPVQGIPQAYIHGGRPPQSFASGINSRVMHGDNFPGEEAAQATGDRGVRSRLKCLVGKDSKGKEKVPGGPESTPSSHGGSGIASGSGTPGGHGTLGGGASYYPPYPNVAHPSLAGPVTAPALTPNAVSSGAAATPAWTPALFKTEELGNFMRYDYWYQVFRSSREFRGSDSELKKLIWLIIVYLHDSVGFVTPADTFESE